MAPITINRNTIDPDPRHHPDGYFAADAADSNFILIQYSHFPNAEDHSRLDRLDVHIIERINDHTLLCRYLSTDLGPLRALPSVEHVTVYHNDFVVHPSVDGASEADGQVAVDIYVHSTCPHDGSDVWESINTEIDPAARLIGHSKWSVKVRMDRAKLAAVAALDHVRAILPVTGAELASNIATPLLRSVDIDHPVNADLDGRGEIVAVADTGYARGAASGPNGHPMFGAGRIVKMTYGDLQSPQAAITFKDRVNHGTGVAGCVAANWTVPVLANTPPTLADVLCGRVTGTATGANLFIINCFDINQVPDNPLGAGDINGLWTIPYDDASGAVAKLYNCSWGTKVSQDAQGRYTNVGYGNVEAVIDASAINDPELLIVVAAHNKGDERFVNVGQTDTILRQVVTEATSKNVLTVGQTYNARWYDTQDLRAPSPTLDAFKNFDATGPATKAALDAVGTNPRSIRRYYFGSSRGPTNNGLIKPEVVAAGVAIVTARGPIGDPLNWSVTTSPLTCYHVGTSFAAPLVTGIAACLRQALRQRTPPCVVTLPQPPGMLIKALLVNGAEELQDTRYEAFDHNGNFGSIAMPPTPNNAIGFGLVNMERSLVALTNNGGGIWHDGSVTAAGVAVTRDIPFPNTDAANRGVLKVTLTWADVPGPAVQNYLQLKLLFVQSDGTAGERDPDPLQALPTENAEPVAQRPDTLEQVVQRVTLHNAVAANYTSFRVQVSCNDPIIPYSFQQPGRAIVNRGDQPFCVAWAFYTTE